jgi:hypothetical protein
MAKISRSQLEKDLQDYKDSLEASKGLPNSVVENNIKYNPSTGQLEYSMPNDLNENQFNENLPTDAANARVYVTYDISKIDTGGRYARSGGDAVRGFTTTSDDLAGMKTSTSTVSGKWTKNQRKRNQTSDATKTTYTLTVDVTDIVQPEGGSGYKDWARAAYGGRKISPADAKNRAGKIIRAIQGAMESNIPNVQGS